MIDDFNFFQQSLEYNFLLVATTREKDVLLVDCIISSSSITLVRW